MKPPTLATMSPRRRIAAIAVAIVLLVALAGLWIMLPPRALDFAGGHAVSLSAYTGPNPTGAPSDLRSADLVARGQYLTVAADCQVCHTATGGQPFAGGRAFPTPFGVLYSPNITADRETGIGAWSDADFIRAVHEGVARGGERLYPAFPYESYTLLSDDDVRAIKAYLFSLPAVRATAPANHLTFPFNQRWLMGIWSALYNPDRRFQPHTDRSPAWNRGAYLAEALGHCGDCHTPRNLAQALDNRRKFAGAVTQGWRAFDITADAASGVGAWSDAQLADYLRNGHASGRGSAGGPMAEEVDFSLNALSPADIAAMVAYLRSIPPIGSRDLPAAKGSAASESPRLMAVGFDPRGKQIFEGACASCHGWSGVSLLTDYATLTGDRAVNDASAINVAQVVLSGERRRTADGEVMMPAFGAAYSDTEIAAVANYVTARFGAAPSHLTARDVARLRQATSQ
ncbi:MAG TPA: c-type cytochrome [Caulobacteraceae bacterium]|nr:c-type cytochrome [Caulobacteraceae bacterium]